MIQIYSGQFLAGNIELLSKPGLTDRVFFKLSVKGELDYEGYLIVDPDSPVLLTDVLKNIEIIYTNKWNEFYDEFKYSGKCVH